MVLTVPARVPKPYPQVASVPRGSRGKDMATVCRACEITNLQDSGALEQLRKFVESNINVYKIRPLVLAALALVDEYRDACDTFDHVCVQYATEDKEW